MIPIAPTTSDTRPRTTKIPLTSFDTASRVALASGGAAPSTATPNPA